MTLTILEVQSGHTGVVHARTSPEASDIALFGFAAIGVWLVRRALRKRFIKSRQRDETLPKKD